jgi:hypothetical protein
VVHAFSQYANGDYREAHPDWHAGDALGKADDLCGLVAIAVAEHDVRSICDIGAGTGDVLRHLAKTLRASSSATPLVFVGYEPSPDAKIMPRADGDSIEMRQVFFDEDGPDHDLALLVDVLEHVGDPRALLLAVRRRTRCLVVRQPLIESFGMFRNDAYREQRIRLGHINCWNTRSFADLMESAGWTATDSSLVAPWELKAPTSTSSLLGRAFVKLSRLYASYFMSGFYQVALYVRTDEQT